ncbi:MAG: hypothetical protein AAGF57_19925 [Pseudomonadota bacterium]
MDSYQLNLMLPRGMLYLYDWRNDHVEIPEYDDSRAVSATPTALSIALTSDEEGDVSVKISQLDNELEYSSRFGTFRLSCPNKMLSLCVMSDDEVHRISLNHHEMEVSISGKSEKFPSEIFISSRSFNGAI